MQIENKSMTMLIAINLVLIVVIIWLVVFILNDKPAPDGYGQIQPQHRPDTPASPVSNIDTPDTPTTDVVSDKKNKSPVELMTEINSAVSMDQEGISVDDRASLAIDKFKTVLKQDETVAAKIADETDKPKRATIPALKNLENLVKEDADYLRQYQAMKAKSINTRLNQQVSSEQAKNIAAIEDSKDIDYFNRIDVSQAKPGAGADKISIASQVRSLVVSKSQAIRPDFKDEQYSKASESDYLASIKPASAVRANETRIIRVKRGETLWRIAVRAYGSGFEYPRIYAANPHLSNPNLITTGEYLRVPL